MSTDRPLSPREPVLAAAATLPALVHAGILACALAPIILTSGLFLIDLPNHIFRSQLIGDILSGIRSTFYVFQPQLLPNLPTDLMAVLTWRFLNGEQSVVLTASLACASFYLSIVYWRRTAGRMTSVWTCLLIVLLLYSRPLYIGLINYILALGIMNVCLARLERNEERPSLIFCATQTVLIVLIYLCSVFPLLLYFSWNLGTALFDAYAQKYRNLPALIYRNAALHIPPVLVVVALILVSDPTPPGEGTLSWFIRRKWESFFTLGAIGNIPYEFVLPVIFLSAIGLRFLSGAFRLGARRLSGIAAMLTCFFLIPAHLAGVALVDMRLLMGIFSVVLATMDESPVVLWRGKDRIAKGLIAGLVAARALSFGVILIPVKELAAPYAELARMVEERSAVAFIYDARSTPDRQRALFGEWEKFVRSGGDYELWGNYLIYGDFWHLHLYYFRRRDVYLGTLFQNFFIRTKPELPFRFVESPWTVEVALAEVANSPYDYVLSHVDLAGRQAGPKRLCLVATRPPVMLYRVQAVDAPPCQPPS